MPCTPLLQFIGDWPCEPHCLCSFVRLGVVVTVVDLVRRCPDCGATLLLSLVLAYALGLLVPAYICYRRALDI